MKKQMLIIYMLLSIFCTPRIYAQQKEKLLTVSGGMSVLSRQDLVYSPFVHGNVSSHNYRLRYQQTGRYFQFTELGFTYNASQSAETPEMDMGDHAHMILPHEFLHFGLSYGIGKAIQPNNSYLAWIGGAFNINLQAGFYNFALSNMFGYFFNQSAQVWYRRAYTFNDKHQLSVHMALPILSWMSRPPYLAEDDEFIENISSHDSAKIIMAFIGDGQLATWNRLQHLNLAAEYKYPIFKNTHIGTEYRFDFIHTNLPRTLLSYQHQLNISATIKFY